MKKSFFKIFPQSILLLLFTTLWNCTTIEEGTWMPKEDLQNKKSSLRELNLSNQELSKISEKIGNFIALEKLNLQGNKLSTLPSSLGKLEQIRKLNLAKNEFTEFPESVLSMKELKELDLRYNPLDKLPEEIKRLTKLHTIYVGGTKIKKEDRRQLRRWLPKVKVIGK